MEVRTSGETHVAVGLLVLVCFFPIVSADAEDMRKFLIDSTSTAINGVSINTTESEIVKRLGNPRAVKVGYSEVEKKESKTLHYDNMTIYLIAGAIYNLACTGKSCLTDRGVKVGDGKARVIKIYGLGNPPYAGATHDSLSYPLKGLDSYLIFEFKDGKVSEIEFFVDYV